MDLASIPANAGIMDNFKFFFNLGLLFLFIATAYYIIYKFLNLNPKSPACKLHTWIREDNLNGGYFLSCSRCYYAPELESLTKKN